MVYGTWVCFVPVQDELAKQLGQRHMQVQLLKIGDRLKGMVKVEPDDAEGDMKGDGLGWGEDLEGDAMEEVELEEEEPKASKASWEWTKEDMQAVKAMAKEGKEKEAEVEVVESAEEEEDMNEKTHVAKGVGKKGGKQGCGGHRVLAPWAKQKKDDWVVKVDEWGGKRFNSGWYHYKNQWYPILVLD